MMTSLRDFCKLLENCALKLEEEIRNSIEICRKNMFMNEFTDSKLALEKAKDFHSKEIVTILSGIITNIKQILYHEGKIKQLNDKNKLSEDEQKEYSYVKRQVSAFSGGEKVVRRELRRAASETSVYCLDQWETFLKNDEVTESVLYSSNSLPNINIVSKRNSPRSKRKLKKLVSSTFENILEDDEAGVKIMEVLSEETLGDINTTSHRTESTAEINCQFTNNLDDNKHEYNTHFQLKDDGKVEESEFQVTENIYDSIPYLNKTNVDIQKDFDTKPRIVGFVIKKNASLEAEPPE